MNNNEVVYSGHSGASSAIYQESTLEILVMNGLSLLPTLVGPYSGQHLKPEPSRVLVADAGPVDTG